MVSSHCRQAVGNTLSVFIVLLAFTPAWAKTEGVVLSKDAMEVTCPPFGDLSFVRGSFYLKNLRLQQRYAYNVWSFDVSGTITNATNRGWSLFQLDFVLRDEAGSEVHTEPILVRDIGRGETKPLSGWIRPVSKIAGNGSKKKAPTSFDVRFVPKIFAFAYHPVVSLVRPEGSKGMLFDDDLLTAQFKMIDGQLGVAITNKTDHAMTINWDEVSFVDSDKLSHRVIHGGVKLADKDKSQAPTVVPPTARMEDVVIAADMVKWHAGGWEETPIIAKLDYTSSAKEVGKLFSLFIPVQANGQKRDYMFTIRIDAVEMD